MFKIGTVHHVLAYAAAAVAAISVILAGIAKLIGQRLGLLPESYMTVATVALLFSIYFLIEGVIYTAKKAK